MSEFRQDRTTGAWAIIAPERGLRPQASSLGAHGPEPPHEFDADCPFCPGNEAKLPGILAETPSHSPPGWQVRVVPNKYPVARSSAPPTRQMIGHQITIPCHGHHEVIIESPRHNANPSSFSDEHIFNLVSLYHQRFSELSSRSGIETVVLFRNQGIAGGASLDHPHSQIIALGMTPPRLRSLADWMGRCWQETGRCVTCDELDLECAHGQRVVENTQTFLAIVPFAASVPFEIWIIPKRHQASLVDINRVECADFGWILRDALRRLRSACGDPPYNFAVESFDFLDRDAAHAHWRLRIAPDLVTWGGFELATGVPINPSSPEADADLLRKAALYEGKLGEFQHI